MTRDNADYKVGYGKPPISSRFKPGQSGHRYGRPKEKLNESDELLKALGKKVRHPDGRMLTKLQLGLEQLKWKSIKGDLAAGALLSQIRAALQVFPSAERCVMYISTVDLDA
jgi:phage-related protein